MPTIIISMWSSGVGCNLGRELDHMLPYGAALLHQRLKHSDVSAVIEPAPLIGNRWGLQWHLAHCPLPHCRAARHPDNFESCCHIDCTQSSTRCIKLLTTILCSTILCTTNWVLFVASVCSLKHCVLYIEIFMARPCLTSKAGSFVVIGQRGEIYNKTKVTARGSNIYQYIPTGESLP